MCRHTHNSGIPGRFAEIVPPETGRRGVSSESTRSSPRFSPYAAGCKLRGNGQGFILLRGTIIFSSRRIHKAGWQHLLLAGAFLILAQPCLAGDPPADPAYTAPRTTEEALALIHRYGAQWTQAQKAHLLENFVRNSDGSFSGAVIASPSTGHKPGEPNYVFHWIRDSALAVEALTRVYRWPDTTDSERTEYLNAMMAYVNFSDQIQRLPISHEFIRFNRDGYPEFVSQNTPGAIPARYGEPKYRVIKKTLKDAQGKPLLDSHGNPRWVWAPGDFNEGWGRPQNDGPALRVSANSRIVSILTARIHDLKTRGQPIPKEIDQALKSATKVIREDLSFIQYRWRDPSFDIWEEVLGEHFYTQSAMSQAITEGLAALKEAGQRVSGAENGVDKSGLERAHAEIEDHLRGYWNGDHISAFHARGDGGRATDKDMAVILAALRRPAGSQFAVSDDKVLATAMDLLEEFQRDPKFGDPPNALRPGHPMGRYPHDHWTGFKREDNPKHDAQGRQITPGNPWVLTTLAMNQFFLKVATQFKQAGQIQINARNRGFFEYVYGGFGHLPPEWQAALKAGKPLTVRLDRNPAQTENLFAQMRMRGAEFSARILASGIDPAKGSPEQFLVVTSKNQSPEVGAQHLTWNAAEYANTIECRNAFQTIIGIVNPAQ